MNKQAVYLAKYFYFKTQRRTTKGTMAQTIGQAKALLSAGFTCQEIEQGIDYCVENPPKKGFYSLGWLSYDLENILVKLKAKQAKETLAQTVSIPDDTVSSIEHSAKNSAQRVKGFDFDMFGDGM